VMGVISQEITPISPFSFLLFPFNRKLKVGHVLQVELQAQNTCTLTFYTNTSSLAQECADAFF